MAGQSTDVDNSLIMGSEFEISLQDDEFITPKLAAYYAEEELELIRIVKREDLYAEMMLEIKDAAELTCLPEQSVRILLNAFKWDKNKMLENTMYGESFIQLRDIGIIVSPIPQDQNLVMPMPNIQILKKGGGKCMMCRKFTGVTSMIFTACDHWFCNRCFQRYLITEIEIGDRSHFQCPHVLCTMFLDDNLVSRELPRHLEETYKKLCVSDFVNGSKFRNSCPTRGCNRTSYCDTSLSTKFREVFCHCGTNYCFGCGKPSHYPLSCVQLKKWINWFGKIPEASSISQFHKDKKPCPFCSKFVSNNWFRENLLCPTCEQRFCWSCLGKANDTHKCSSKLSENIQPEIAPMVKIRQDYDKLKNTFSNNVMSEMKVVLDQTSNQNQRGELGEGESMIKAFDDIGKAQNFLRYSFAFAYFLDNKFEKLAYLKHFFQLKKVLGKLVDQFDIDKDMVMFAHDVCKERDELRKIVIRGFEEDVWIFRETEELAPYFL